LERTTRLTPHQKNKGAEDGRKKLGESVRKKEESFGVCLVLGRYAFPQKKKVFLKVWTEYKGHVGSKQRMEGKEERRACSRNTCNGKGGCFGSN